MICKIHFLWVTLSLTHAVHVKTHPHAVKMESYDEDRIQTQPVR